MSCSLVSVFVVFVMFVVFVFTMPMLRGFVRRPPLRRSESRDLHFPRVAHNFRRSTAPLLSTEIPPPVVRDYTAEAEAAFESTPEDMELNEILKEQGHKAMDRRAREHQRNLERRK